MDWFCAVIVGVGLGVGVAFAVMAGLLNKSNNIGDSRDDIEKYGLGVTMTSSEDFGAIMPGSIIDSYCEASVSMFTHDKSIIEFANHKLSVIPERPLERYIPKPEDKLAEEAMKKLAEELKEEGTVYNGKSRAPEKPVDLTSGMDNLTKGTSGGASGGGILGGLGAAGVAAASKERPAPLWDAPKPEPKKQEKIFDPVEAEIAMMFGDDLPTGEIDPEAQQFLQPDAPVYEAPTASKPLWESANPDEDFSDFEEDEF